MIEDIQGWYTIPVLAELGKRLDGMGTKLDGRGYSYEFYLTSTDSVVDFQRVLVSGSYEALMESLRDYQNPQRPTDFDVLWVFLAVPFEEVPMFVGSPNELVQELIQWRLKLGR